MKPTCSVAVAIPSRRRASRSLAAMPLLVAALAAGLLPAGPAAADPPEEYAVARIDQMLGEFWSMSLAINADGDAVGYYIDSATNKRRAFVYSYEHGAIPLPAFAGFPETQAVSVSDRDAGGDIIIAGSAGDQEFWPTSSTATAVYWRYSTVTGQVTQSVNIGRLPGLASSQSTAVNNHGKIVGYSRNLGLQGAFQAHVYDVATGVLSPLNFPTMPTSLNNANQIAGDNYIGDLTGAFAVLPAPPDVNWIIIEDLNDAGHVLATVVFSVHDGAGNLHKGIAVHDGQWHLTGFLGGLARAVDINNAGDVLGVVGVIGAGDGVIRYAGTSQLYDPGSLITPLQWTDINAFQAINDRGQIASGVPATLMTPLGRMIIPGDVSGDARVLPDDLCAWTAAPIDLDGDADADQADYDWLVARLASLGFGNPDCNANGAADVCDIASGTSADCNANGIPDECEPDCDGDGTPDECESDCNGNGVPDPCDIASGASDDCNGNGIPDECDAPDTVLAPRVYTPPQQLLPNSTFADTILVTDAGTTADVNFSVSLDYRVSEVTLRLSHAGVTVTLSDQAGKGINPNFPDGFRNLGYRITLDDEGAGGNIQTTGSWSAFEPLLSPPSYQPMQPLAAFDGLPREGLWTLEVITGPNQVFNPNIASWSLSITDQGVDPGECCPADFNGDDTVNSTDISAFLTAWLASLQSGDLAADFNADDQVNSADISAFLTAWLDAVQNGC